MTHIHRDSESAMVHSLIGRGLPVNYEKEMMSIMIFTLSQKRGAWPCMLMFD